MEKWSDVRTWKMPRRRRRVVIVLREESGDGIGAIT
jgi:hypothetical protein